MCGASEIRTVMRHSATAHRRRLPRRYSGEVEIRLGKDRRGFALRVIIWLLLKRQPVVVHQTAGQPKTQQPPLRSRQGQRSASASLTATTQVRGNIREGGRRRELVAPSYLLFIAGGDIPNRSVSTTSVGGCPTSPDFEILMQAYRSLRIAGRRYSEVKRYGREIRRLATFFDYFCS